VASTLRFFQPPVRSDLRKTTLFRTPQSALALAETAGVAPTLFRGIVEPFWRRHSPGVLPQLEMEKAFFHKKR
jgi:hypothetical protein